MAVCLGFLAGLSLALQPLGGCGQEFLYLLQALLLGGELQDLLARLGLELDAAGDGEGEVPVGRLYLDADGALGRGLDDPLQRALCTPRPGTDVLLGLLLEVLDLPT